MTNRKISQLPPFIGRNLLLEAQKKGIEVTQGRMTDGAAVTLIGLAVLLAEAGVLKEKEE